MKISVIQPEIIWEDKTANLQNLINIIMPLSGKTDIVILPEMFNTGFSMNPSVLGEPHDGETFQWMKQLAEKCDFGICGSYVVRENAKFYNRWVFVSPEGQTSTYDKRHLFSMGGENKLFTPGKYRLVFSFRGFKISGYICYDLRFPVWSRNREKSDLIIYSANWPQSRKNVWNVLLRARAIENQCYVAGSNPSGIDGKGINYEGDSMIVDPKGELLISAQNSQNCSITTEISLDELSNFRKKFPVLDDADDFSLRTSRSLKLNKPGF